MTTTYAADTFTRANGPVGKATTGGAWSAAGAASTWAIASHQLTGRSTGGYGAFLTLDDGHSDGAIQAKFVIGASAGLIFRLTSASDYWCLTLGVGQYIRLSYMNPASGYVTKADPGAAAAMGDIFRIELAGPSMKVFQNDKQLISMSDKTGAGATSHGFLTAGTGLSKFDSFSHSALGGGTTAPPTSATVHRYFNIGGVAVPVS